MKRFTSCLVLTAMAAAAYAAASGAADFPAKPVKLVLAQGPGGPNDAVARAVTARLTQAWGQPVVFDYRPGANTLIAFEYVAKSPGDGYTLLLNTTSYVQLPLLNKNLNFDPVKDLRLVGLTHVAYPMIVIHASVPARNLAEFVAYSKANPGKLNYGSLGKSGPMLAAEWFKMETGTVMAEVPYKDFPAMTQGLLRGDVHYAQGPGLGYKGAIDGGTLRPLFVIGAKRQPEFPNVPTASEVGLKDFDTSTYIGVLVPSTTPRPVQEKLNADLRAALEAEDVRNVIHKIGNEPISMTLDQIDALVQNLTAKWNAVAKTAHVQPD